MLLVHSPPATSMRVKAMLTKSAAARLPALLCSFLPLMLKNKAPSEMSGPANRRASRRQTGRSTRQLCEIKASRVP